MSEAENKPVTGTGEPAPEGLGSGTPNPTSSGRTEHVTRRQPARPDVEELVIAFVRTLEEHYPARVKRRAKAFKQRILTLFRRHLPPYPKPAGRPNKSNITAAARMYQEQQREIEVGKRARPNWCSILAACVPEYSRIRSSYRRAAVTRRLQSAVYARLHRQSERRTRNHARKRRRPNPPVPEPRPGPL
jgi:hypothetical protein